MRQLIAALLVLILAGPAVAWGPPSPHPTPQPPSFISLNAYGWRAITGGLWWQAPFNDPATGHLRATLPPLTIGTLNALHTNAAYTLTGVSRLRAVVTVESTSGSPVVGYPANGCSSPAKVRLFLYSLADRGTEWERWYAQGAWQDVQTVLDYAASYPFGLTGDLTNPAAWTSVNGHPATDNPAAFEAAKAGSQVGVVFGGGCFYGHGVGMAQGAAEFVTQWMWTE